MHYLLKIVKKVHEQNKKIVKGILIVLFPIVLTLSKTKNNAKSKYIDESFDDLNCTYGINAQNDAIKKLKSIN